MKRFFIRSKTTWAFPRRLKRLLLAIVIVSFVFTGCRKDFQHEQNPITNPDIGMQIPDAPLKPSLGKLEVMPPSENGESARTSPITLDVNPFNHSYRNMVLRAMNASEETCDDNTKLYQWLDKQLDDWSISVIVNALNTAMLDLPTYHALFLENRSLGQYFGRRGEYTLRVVLSFLQLKRFWDIKSNDKALIGLHGNMLNNRTKVYNTYNKIYQLEPADALYFTNLVELSLRTYPQYRKGDHAIFSFNAYASPLAYYAPVGFIPPKIVIGDGILEGFAAIGYGDISPQAIVAHEYGHQVQFSNGIYNYEETPESGRRIELMADALASYYLTHIRGEILRWGRTKQFSGSVF